MNIYGCFQQDKLVGGMILYDFKMNLYGKNVVKCGGIGEVCVGLLYKKEHVAKDLMIFAHNHYYKRGYCLTCLYPFRPDFYANMGYGLGNKMNQYCFEPKALQKSKKSNISYLSLSDLKSVFTCYQRYTSTTHGMILRTEDSRIFKQILEGMKTIGYWENGDLAGYLAFRMRRVEGGSWLQHNIHIIEFIYESPNAFRSLLTFLATQQDQIHRIIYNTHDHYFHHFLNEPRSRGSENIFHIFQESNIQGVGVMYRVINTEKFFTLLSDHRFGDQTIKLKLAVRDSFLPINDGEMLVHFQEGKPTLISANEEKVVKISLNVEHFSSLIMGAISLKRLYEYGLIQITDISHLGLLNKLFRTEEPPYTMEPF
ncbi:MAG: enhanced intracellular survival protein Eis [Promethearchaeota archaeon]